MKLRKVLFSYFLNLYFLNTCISFYLKNIGGFLCLIFILFCLDLFSGPHGMRDLSSLNQGSNLHPFLGKDEVRSAGPPGKSLFCLVLKKES